jgi:hypothetical protein
MYFYRLQIHWEIKKKKVRLYNGTAEPKKEPAAVALAL